MHQHAAFVVVGDLGHSPRMNYHIKSLISACEAEERMTETKENTNSPKSSSQSNKWKIDFIGYLPKRQSDILVSSCEDVKIHEILALPSVFSSDSKSIVAGMPVRLLLLIPLNILYALFKVLFQCLHLFWILSFKISRPKILLVQIPPSIPLLVIITVCKWTFLRKSLWILDWHNTGTSLVSLRMGPKHVVTKLSHWIEHNFIQSADVHLCVTEALQRSVQKRISSSPVVPVVVLYDKAQEHFRRLSEAERKLFLTRDLRQKYESSLKLDGLIGEEEDLNSIFWMVTSTSWTPDENFDLMLSSLCELDRILSERKGQINFTIVLIITGKGPLREKYMAELERLSLNWKNQIIVRDVWLSLEDYPRLLGSCDLGISLHQSSSGLDLPMKVVDMFGCGLPCCAVKFSCLHELVQDGVNGLIFENSMELAEQIYGLIEQFPDRSKMSQWQNLLNGVQAWKIAHGSFQQHWKERVYPFFRQISN